MLFYIQHRPLLHRWIKTCMLISVLYSKLLLTIILKSNTYFLSSTEVHVTNLYGVSIERVSFHKYLGFLTQCWAFIQKTFPLKPSWLFKTKAMSSSSFLWVIDCDVIHMHCPASTIKPPESLLLCHLVHTYGRLSNTSLFNPSAKEVMFPPVSVLFVSRVVQKKILSPLAPN